MRFDTLTRVTGPFKIRVLKIIPELMYQYVSTRDLEELHNSTLKMEAALSFELFILSYVTPAYQK